jgi:hypothetical protein
MAISHLQFNDATAHGRLLRSWLNAAEVVIDTGDDIIRKMPTMIDGDGSSIAHFDEVVRRLGVGGWVADNAVTDAQRIIAKALWDEFQSAYSKVSGDGNVSAVNAALKQIIAKCR